MLATHRHTFIPVRPLCTKGTHYDRSYRRWTQVCEAAFGRRVRENTPPIERDAAVNSASRKHWTLRVQRLHFQSARHPASPKQAISDSSQDGEMPQQLDQ